MRSLTLTDRAGSIVSILELPRHATIAECARIVAAALSLAHARGWGASLTVDGATERAASVDCEAGRLAHYDLSAGVAYA